MINRSAKDNKEENKNIDVEEEIVIQTGMIDGETLKIMAMGKYFKDCEIDAMKKRYTRLTYMNRKMSKIEVVVWQ